MSKYVIDETTLTAIGDAVRAKDGTTEPILVSQLATRIEAIPQEGGGGGESLPDEAFVFSGNCKYVFANGHWDWFINNYGDKIATKDINNSNYMFASSTGIESIPFDMNYKDGTQIDVSYTFQDSTGIKSIGTINNLYPFGMSNFFNGCWNLRYIPTFVNFNPSRINSYGYANISSIFAKCYSLRNIPKDLLKQLWGIQTSYTYCHLNSLVSECINLDEIKGISPKTGTMTSNMFNYTTTSLCRVKEFIFDMQDDGTPYIANWKTQTIKLQSVGYMSNPTSQEKYILNYNSGITVDKKVTDDASYQALKDDPDWYTGDMNYSRYNHTSAVNTINSLPDTSAYLATAGGTNTIIFKGAAGALTDDGAVSNLTEEEIAVATAKGWTVTLQ